MYLRKKKVNDRIYLSIVKCYRDKNGKAKSETIKTIGFADSYLDQHKDPIAYFTKVAKEMTAKEQEKYAPINIKLFANANLNLVHF